MTTSDTTPAHQYLRPLADHRVLIMVVTVLVTALGVGVGFLAPTTYESSTTIVVYPISGDPTEALETDDSNVDMATELRIATSQAVVDVVQEKLADQSIELSNDEISEHVIASTTKDSRVLDIAFSAGSPEVARAGADAFAEAYLEFRSELANSNKLAAETTINGRIAVLQERLAEVSVRLASLDAESGSAVVLAVEESSIRGELSAQQRALADLSTLTVDSTRVIDQADLPTSPEGLSLIQTVVGSLAGGLVLGIIAAYAAAALSEANRPHNRRMTDKQAPQVMESLHGVMAALTTAAQTGKRTATSEQLEQLDQLDELIAADQAEVSEPDPVAATPTPPTPPTPTTPTPAASAPVASATATSAIAASPKVETANAVADRVEPKTPTAPMTASTPGPSTVADSTPVSGGTGTAHTPIGSETASSVSPTSTPVPAASAPQKPAPASATPPPALASTVISDSPWQPPTAPHSAPADDASSPSDTADTADTPDAPDAPDTADTPDVPDTAVAPNTADAANAGETAEALTSAQVVDPLRNIPPVLRGATDNSPSDVHEPEEGLSADESATESSASQDLNDDASVTEDRVGGISFDETSIDKNPFDESPFDESPRKPSPTDEEDSAVGATSTGVSELQWTSAEADALSVPSPAVDDHDTLITKSNTDDLIDRLQSLGTVGPVVALSVGDNSASSSLAVAFELAGELQALGAKVLLVDAAVEEPMLHSLLRVDPCPGLSDVLSGRSPLLQAARSLPGIDGLDAITIGSVDITTVDSLTGSPFERLVAEARNTYHLTLIVGGNVHDDQIVPSLADNCDGLILSTARAAGEEAKPELAHRLASLPLPTLDLISAVSASARLEEAIGAPSM